MNKRSKGQEYEDKAVNHIKGLGMTLIDRNFYTKFGELDIIALDSETLVFIEVKYRSNGSYGHPAEAVTFQKQKRMIASSKWYMMKNGYRDINVRYDVCGWHRGKLEYYKGAFYYGS